MSSFICYFVIEDEISSLRRNFPSQKEAAEDDAAHISGLFVLRLSSAQWKELLVRTIARMKVPIPVIATVVGLGFTTRYAGMDAILGLAFTKTGAIYPFFAAMLGWLGVFLTGSDTASNAMFGSLQQITAEQLGLSE
ncbi:MAG: L-lactate permease [Hydrogenibacillus schlegelii]|nr:L-lactate permease [Hydrogenibacillus schlegelii]